MKGQLMANRVRVMRELNDIVLHTLGSLGNAERGQVVWRLVYVECVIRAALEGRRKLAA